MGSRRHAYRTRRPTHSKRLKSALDTVLDGDTELRAIEADLKSAEDANDGERIGRAHARLADIDAYSAPARARQILMGLGFAESEHGNPLDSFSGGWRMRLNLAQALIARADILALDEPTNHLDLDAVVWLESWLKSYEGTLLVISHDRDFQIQLSITWFTSNPNRSSCTAAIFQALRISEQPHWRGIQRSQPDKRSVEVKSNLSWTDLEPKRQRQGRFKAALKHWSAWSKSN